MRTLSLSVFAIMLCLAGQNAVTIGLGTSPLIAMAGEDADHEDVDYRFRITHPGSGWQVLAEADSRRLVPDSIAGIHGGRGTFALIVEEAPETSLDEIVSLLQSAQNVEEKSLSAVETLVYQGVPARRWTSEGRVGEVSFRFRQLVFRRGRFVFQVLGFGLAAPPDGLEVDLDLMAKQLVLLDGEIRARTLHASMHDVAAVGWRVKGGVYQDAVNGLEVKPPPGWRIAVGSELRTVNDSACVGLVSSDPDAFIVVISERALGVDEGPFLESLRAGVAEHAEPTGKPSSALVGGREFRMHPYNMTQPVEVRLHHGARIDGGRCVQIQWWAMEGLVDRAGPEVTQALAAIRFLDAAASKLLADELAMTPDPQEHVGERHALRGGIYRDFEHGFVWKKPPARFWSVSAGQDARDRHADATIYLEEPSLGLSGVVIAKKLPGSESAKFHDHLVEQMSPVGGAPTPKRIALQGAVALSSDAVPRSEGLPLRHVVTSVVRGDRTYQLVIWGFEGNVAAARPAIDAAIRGLEFPERLVAAESVDGTHVDHRLGFRLRRPPGAGWKYSVVTPRALAPLASLVQFEHRKGGILAGAFCALSEEQDEKFMRDLVIRLLRERLGGKEFTSEESPVSFAGRPGRRIAVTGPQRLIAWIVNRGRTLYLVIAGTDGGLEFRDEDGHALLELID